MYGDQFGEFDAVKNKCMLFSFFTWQHFDETAHNSLLKEMFTQVCVIQPEGFGCLDFLFCFACLLFFPSIILEVMFGHNYVSYCRFLARLATIPKVNHL